MDNTEQDISVSVVGSMHDVTSELVVTLGTDEGRLLGSDAM
jgi:hypothetical protein